MDQGRSHLDGGSQYSRQLHQQAFFAVASGLKQGGFLAVEFSADDPDGFAYHVRGDFFGKVVPDFGGGATRADEEVHVGVAHCDGCGLGAFGEAVLEGVGGSDDAVEWLAERFDEEHVGDHGYFAAVSPPCYVHHDPVERGEDFKASFGKLLIGFYLGVGALEVAHHIPSGTVDFVGSVDG